MTYDLVVTDGLVVTPDGAAQANVGIAGGRVETITADPISGREAISARGRTVLPGAVDIHVHFNEPGRTHWEGWGPGSRAAAAGGVTTVVEMPLNAIPPTTTPDALAAKVAAAERSSAVDFALWGGLVTNNLDHLPALAHGGVIGFKAFMCATGTPEFTPVDDALLAEGLAQIRRLAGLLAVHAESETLTRELTRQLRSAGRADRAAWGESRPPQAELDAVRRVLALAAQAGCRLHIVHMSLPEGVDLVTEAKQQGQAVTVETCAHYLTLTEDDLIRLGPVAKCAPPLRDRSRQEAMWERVMAGHVDCITSDHSPCPTADKTKGDEDIFAAWGGITGVQTLVPLMLSEGVHRRGMTWGQFVTLLAANPARIAGLWPRKGAIQVGADADLMIVDLDRRWVVDRSWLQSRHTHSPFLGLQMHGAVEHVLVRGRTVAADGVVAAGAGGAWLPSTATTAI